MTEKEFIAKWINVLSSNRLKNFPADFIDKLECSELALPTVNLILGEEIFGQHEILDTQGNSFMLTENIFLAKYILYANRHRISSVPVPKQETDIENLVRQYEKHIDKILKEIETEYKKEFPKAVTLMSAINKIFSSLNIKRY